MDGSRKLITGQWWIPATVVYPLQHSNIQQKMQLCTLWRLERERNLWWRNLSLLLKYSGGIWAMTLRLLGWRRWVKIKNLGTCRRQNSFGWSFLVLFVFYLYICPFLCCWFSCLIFFNFFYMYHFAFMFVMDEKECKWFEQNWWNWKSKPNQTEIVFNLEWFGLKLNRSSLVQLSVFYFDIQGTDANIFSHYINIILPHTYLWLDRKLKTNLKYFLTHLISLISSHGSNFISFLPKENPNRQSHLT